MHTTCHTSPLFTSVFKIMYICMCMYIYIFIVREIIYIIALFTLQIVHFHQKRMLQIVRGFCFTIVLDGKNGLVHVHVCVTIFL